MTLPLIFSVPHAGLMIPDEVADACLLTQSEIIADGDEFAAEIYDPLEYHVRYYLTTPIARAFIDLNRAADDFRMDGVVKTHTCWRKKIYSNDLSEKTIALLLKKYYFPYHAQLTQFSKADVKLGIDCHTMADHGPPVGPDVGKSRPDICLSVDQNRLPRHWGEHMQTLLRHYF